MPVTKPKLGSAPVFYPDTDYTIVKYLDLTKFISLLQRQSLFFCRLDKLEDHYEGVMGKATINRISLMQQYLRDETGFTSPRMTDNQLMQNINNLKDLQQKLKSINCVNCWNKKDSESVALWKIYSDFSKGIMIKSTIEKLISSLKKSTKKIQLSEVRYINYDTEIFPNFNLNYPIIHKQMAYSYEDEVRLIHEVDHVNWIHDWSQEEIEEGVFINVDLEVLISEIIISPYSPKWFVNLVEDITKKYGLNIPVKESILSYSK